MQGRSAAQEKRRSELTLQELQELPAETKTFLNVGKMYVLQPKTAIEESVSRLGGVRSYAGFVVLAEESFIGHLHRY